jgi:hypothetical protein
MFLTGIKKSIKGFELIIVLSIFISGNVMTAAKANAATQIIADHTIVDRYDDIPAGYMAEVKKMMVYFPGESHSAAYRDGMTLLETANPTYACHVSTGESYNPANQYLRVNSGGAGEADWYTWYAYPVESRPAAKDTIKNSIAQYNTHGHPMHAIGFGWCWDTTWTNGPGGTVDPIYNVRWAGASSGGPDGDLRWGLDDDDITLTGNRVTMNTYLEATEEYRLYAISIGSPTKVIFTTSPADGYTGESGYQRYLKHQYIRAFVQANPARILFDYSDILCNDDDGTPNTASWDGHTYPHITTTNLGDGNVGHIGAAGAIRLAKAQWWMLARIAGWDGVSTCANLPVRNIAITDYTAVQTGYSAAGSGNSVLIQSLVFDEDLILNNVAPVKLLGGYDCYYSSNSGSTTITGTVTIAGTAGAVTMDRVTIR